MLAGRIWAGASLSLALGCADLGALDAGICGNGILDPGEDCDTSAASCGAPKAASECRFVCEVDADCPSNHKCGADGICRQPTGDFEQGSIILGESVTDARLGDIDADGRSDVVMVNRSGRLDVSYVGAEGVTGTSSFQTSSIPLAIAQLTDGDSRADIVHLPNLRVGVLRSLSGRTLEPTAYSPIPVPQDDARFFVLEARFPIVDDEVSYFGGQEILQFSGNEIRSIVGQETLLFGVPYSATEATPVEREITTGNLDTSVGSPCDEFVLTKSGHDRVSVYTPCEAPGTKWNHAANALPEVMMPGSAKTGNGVLVTHVDADPHLDLVIAGLAYPNPDFDPFTNDVEEMEKVDLYVAYGAGDGTFHDALGTIGVASELLHGVFGLPLAAADFTSDGLVDFVFRRSIRPSSNCGTVLVDCWITLQPQQAPWARATIDDFNGNGYLDIVAIAENSRYVEFFNGTAAQNGIFNQFRIPTSGAPIQLGKGDFDGDLLPDVVISEADESAVKGVEGALEPVETATQHDSLSILFGKSQGAPEAPVSMGKLNRIEGIAAGQFWFQGNADYVSDLGVLSRNDETNTRSVALFTGDTNRQLQSPFVLADPNGQSDFAVNVAVGKFSGEEHADVAAFAVTLGTNIADSHARLWLLESTGEAELAESKAKASPANLDDLDVDPCSMSIVPLDIEDDGTEELALLGRPKGDDQPGGRIVVARAEGGVWQFGSPVEVDARFANAFDPRFLCRAIRANQQTATTNGDYEDRSLFQVTDYDGDGQRELLALTRTDDYAAHRLSVFPLGPDLGVNSREIALPEDMEVLGFHALSTDADPEQEFVLVTYGAVYLADVDLDAQQLTQLKLLAGSDISEVPAPGRKDPDTTPGGVNTGLVNFIGATLSIQDGDFNGDRLVDFAVVHEGGTDLFLATAVRP